MQAGVQTLADTFFLKDREQLIGIGIEVGKLYTDFGLPVDMAIDRLTQFGKEQKVCVIDGVCQWLIQHKRNSGASEKAIERQRKANAKMLDSFIKKGEVGIY